MKNTILLRQYKLLFSMLSGLILFNFGCTKEWDEHYTPSDDVINVKMWDYLVEDDNFSLFTTYIIENELDSLLKSNQQYTLFIPPNTAFENVPDSIQIDKFILSHLISPTIINLRNIADHKKLQTIVGKFALIEKVDEEYFFDEIKITDTSPLFLNGRYYVVNELPFAKPNFEEYFKLHLPSIYNYITSQVYDSLDKAASTPIAFDDDGNTIYDSVFITINPFENKYYPISLESRDEYATFVLFSQEQYNSALDLMAGNMGGAFQSHNDIPLTWQESVILPHILDNGVFEDILSIEVLSNPYLININGYPAKVDVSNVDPESRILCSNGVIYNFSDFTVDDSLYLGDISKEGESLLDSIGNNEFSWNESVKLSGEIIEPEMLYSNEASNGRVAITRMGFSFSGTYSVEFTFQNIFPGRHRLEWRAPYRPSGVFTIYVNNEEVGEFDSFNLRYSIPSITGSIFRPSSAGFNSVDFWVNNITEYGDVKVKFEFKESGVSSDNGLAIDYVSLIPAPL
ncbi:fasciclin domain-containing protein [Bacteroidota bacterium]